MKSINPDNFKVTGKIDLSKIPTNLFNEASDDDKEEKLDKVQLKLSALQDVMYAHNRYGVLICLQGMDTSGKDSLIREVFREFNPRGVEVLVLKRQIQQSWNMIICGGIIWLCLKKANLLFLTGRITRMFWLPVCILNTS